MRLLLRRLTLLVCLAGFACSATAARIGELTQTDWVQQAVRYFSFADPAVRTSLAGCLLLGLACGVLGSFLLVRRLSMAGDVISHAVLPGIVLGIWWQGSKASLGLVAGAAATALAAIALTQWLRSTTRLKEDAVFGLTLGSFYAAGVFCVSLAQQAPGTAKSGIEKYFLGQAAALTEADVLLIGCSALAACITAAAFRKELLATAFDPGFALSAGMPVRFLEKLILGLLTFAVVAAVQAVGVVMVTALLITPAATAFLLVRRFWWMALVAVLVGTGSAATGSFISFLDSGLPTGPFIVLSASTCFLAALLFAPRRGLIIRLLQRQRDASRIRTENALKLLYRAKENTGGRGLVDVEDLGVQSGGDLSRGRHLARRLVRRGLATWAGGGTTVALTPEGWHRASSVVRKHRLWELYLSHVAAVPSDHVHDDAEDMEHFLDEETVRRLEKRLAFAHSDPHGRNIPTAEQENDAGRPPPARGRASP